MDKTEKRIILKLSILVLVLLAAVLIQHTNQQVEVRDFVPPSFDANALSGEPEVAYPDMYGTLSLNDEVTVSLYSAPIVTDGTALVCFTADAGNTAWVRLRLQDTDGKILGQSDLLRPGEYVARVKLTTQPDRPEAIAKILTYEPDTYYSLGTATAQVLLQFADE